MIAHSLSGSDEPLDSWSGLRSADRVAAFKELPDEDKDNFFLALPSTAQAKLLLALPEGERRLYLRLLAPDGSMLPFILRKCGLDPASASAPFVATLVDVTGLVIYFTIAKLMLTGVLL